MTIVALGSVVKIQIDNMSPRNIQIRKGESDPANDIVSSETPVAKAILGAREGDKRTFKVRGAVKTVRVLKIFS